MMDFIRFPTPLLEFNMYLIYENPQHPLLICLERGSDEI